MKKVTNELMDWLWSFADLLKVLLVIGLLVGVLFKNDEFGMVARLSDLMTQIGSDGVVGLIALVVLLSWYKKK
tara:strand:- start:471 stop:689 length:219 start_codon:yes stop_codon:yes gene_type:complete